MRGAAAVLALSLACTASAAHEGDPDGMWFRGDGNACVRIAPCGSKLCATNLWIKDTSNGEDVGDRLVMSLNPESDVEFSGSAYDPKRDRSYSMILTVGPDGLTTRGCVLFGLLCKNVNWTPVKGC